MSLILCSGSALNFTQGVQNLVSWGSGFPLLVIVSQRCFHTTFYILKILVVIKVGSQ